MKAPLLAAAAWLVATCALAEIRIERSRDGGSLDVVATLTPSGPWTAEGPVDATVLNPNGDFHGDGAPALLESDAGWLAAWASPARERLLLARATYAWQPTLYVDAPGVLGTPLVLRAPGAWLAVTRLSDGRLGMAGLTDEPRVSELVDLGEGRLLGGSTVGDRLHLYVGTRDGGTDVIVVQILVPDPQPIDISRHRIFAPGRPGERPVRSRTRDPYSTPLEPRLEPLPEGRGEDGARARADVRVMNSPDGSATAVVTIGRETIELAEDGRPTGR